MAPIARHGSQESYFVGRVCVHCIVYMYRLARRLVACSDPRESLFDCEAHITCLITSLHTH